MENNINSLDDVNLITHEESELNEIENKVEINTNTSKSIDVSRILPEVIESAIEKDIRVVLIKNGAYEVEGFYKLSPLQLLPTDKGLVARNHKNKEVLINHIDDLIKLNFEVWKYYRNKIEYSNPDKAFLDEFFRLDYIEKQIVYNPKN